MLISSSLIADVSYKIIFTGDSDVGKTALINRFKNDTFDPNSRPTVGVEFAKRILKYRKSNQNIQIHLWDTAGQERYKSITKQHYRGADASLVVFDLDQPRSFSSLVNWINEARDNSPPECILGLIGNKVDKDNETTRTVSREAYNFAKENRILYYETSSFWGRTKSESEEKHYAKGIENIVLDLVENATIRNPKKALCLYEKELTYENENVTVNSVYGLTPSRYSGDILGEGLSIGRCNTKGSSGSILKEVVSLNIKSEQKAKEKSNCGCV